MTGQQTPSTALAVSPAPAIQLGGHTPAELKDLIKSLRVFVHEVLIDGTDYGTIPGTNKASLLKPGAERLCQLYGLSPTFSYEKEVETWDAVEPLFYYRVKCVLVHRASGAVAGEGLGSCNSRESKYRYRVEYWKDKKAEPPAGEGWTKFKGPYGWSWRRRTPNPDIADVANTVLKMATKRAQIDATLRVTGTSEFFAQDLEDLPKDLRHTASDGADDEGGPAPAAAPANVEAPKDGIPPDVAKQHAAWRKRLHAAKTAEDLPAIAADMRKLPMYLLLKDEFARRKVELEKGTAKEATDAQTAAAEPEPPLAEDEPDEGGAEPVDDPGPCAITEGCLLPDGHPDDCAPQGIAPADDPKESVADFDPPAAAGKKGGKR